MRSFALKNFELLENLEIENLINDNSSKIRLQTLYEIEKRETPGYLNKTWFYNPIPNARSNARRKYKTEIYSENGFITHWDILS